jgi:hypothetical protein
MKKCVKQKQNLFGDGMLVKQWFYTIAHLNRPILGDL